MSSVTQAFHKELGDLWLCNSNLSLHGIPVAAVDFVRSPPRTIRKFLTFILFRGGADETTQQ